IFTNSLLRDTTHKQYDEDYHTLTKDFDYFHSLNLMTYANYDYTAYLPSYSDVLDHIFFDQTTLSFKRCIPMPSHSEVTEFVGLPSCKIPSDHLAVIVDLEMRQDITNNLKAN
ncbi:unnamed protein product, partial [Didymodactylos carnosus]